MPRGSGSTEQVQRYPRRRRVAAVRRRRVSTSCSGMRCCTTCPTSNAPSLSFTGCCEPGGRILFAGEPSRIGDRIATVPKRSRQLAAPLWRARAACGTRAAHAGSRLARAHAITSSRARSTSTPSRPPTSTARAADAGFTDVTVRGEELVANWFGWFNRALEATAGPRRCADVVAPLRVPRLPAPAAARPACARAATAAGALLQPAADRAQGRSDTTAR